PDLAPVAQAFQIFGSGEGTRLAGDHFLGPGTHGSFSLPSAPPAAVRRSLLSPSAAPHRLTRRRACFYSIPPKNARAAWPRWDRRRVLLYCVQGRDRGTPALELATIHPPPGGAIACDGFLMQETPLPNPPPQGGREHAEIVAPSYLTAKRG